MLKSKGFTLVEISIVLVIIGLILGAVFVGAQVLIATTKNTGTVTLIKDLSGAIIGFKSRYHYLPGDLPSAALDIQNISTGATGCDIAPPFAGIGNGLIDANEQKCVVEELVLSGFMKGSSTAPGFISPLNQGTTPDVIVRSAITSKVNVASISNPLVKAFPSTVQNVIEISGISCDAATAIDSKLDDGDTTTGNIKVAPQCIPGALPPTTNLDVGL
jgi:prepilin-type N-terminal cleavage/methylation domain-containing protein